jgi:hypothetical protein
MGGTTADVRKRAFISSFKLSKSFVRVPSAPDFLNIQTMRSARNCGSSVIEVLS